jgi:predicted flavoprotein YhiN
MVETFRRPRLDEVAITVLTTRKLEVKLLAGLLFFVGCVLDVTAIVWMGTA